MELGLLQGQRFLVLKVFKGHLGWLGVGIIAAIWAKTVSKVAIAMYSGNKILVTHGSSARRQ